MCWPKNIVVFNNCTKLYNNKKNFSSQSNPSGRSWPSFSLNPDRCSNGGRSSTSGVFFFSKNNSMSSAAVDRVSVWLWHLWNPRLSAVCFSFTVFLTFIQKQIQLNLWSKYTQPCAFTWKLADVHAGCWLFLSRINLWKSEKFMQLLRVPHGS